MASPCPTSRTETLGAAKKTTLTITIATQAITVATAYLSCRLLGLGHASKTRPATTNGANFHESETLTGTEANDRPPTKRTSHSSAAQPVAESEMSTSPRTGTQDIAQLTTPSVTMGAKSGPTTTFERGPTRESRPKVDALSTQVAAWHTSDAARVERIALMVLELRRQACVGIRPDHNDRTPRRSNGAGEMRASIASV